MLISKLMVCFDSQDEVTVGERNYMFIYYSLETNLTIPLQFYLFKWLSKEIMKRASMWKLGAIVHNAAKDHSEAVLWKKDNKTREEGKTWD